MHGALRSMVLTLAALVWPWAAVAVDHPGTRFRVDFADLPAPGATTSANNTARTILRPANATLEVPPGFKVNIFAQGLSNARWLAIAENGDVFVAEPAAGRVTLLRDADGDGIAEVARTYISGLDRPHGLAIVAGYLYVTTPTTILRYPRRPGEVTPAGPPQGLGGRNPLGDGQGHFTRNLAIAPDGRQIFVAVGSRTNLSAEAAPRATIQSFDINGTAQQTFAAGLRNPVGLAFRPGSNDLYTVVNERDGYGDGLVPDYFTVARQGDFFGWPFAYLGPHPSQGVLGLQRPDLVLSAKAPDVLFEAHSAPLGLAFYEGGQFPAEYRGDAFVALHGSWNSGRPTGYKVVRIPFGPDGRPTGEYVNFATGFWVGGDKTAEVFGRPVGLAIAADGALLIADDVGNVIWRVSYGR